MSKYTQIDYAVGCESDRPMGIPGQALEGSFAATDLVGWYNGHPDHRLHRFGLSSEAVAIVGRNRNWLQRVNEVRCIDLQSGEAQ